jgi:hypothetical protein
LSSSLLTTYVVVLLQLSSCFFVPPSCNLSCLGGVSSFLILWNTYR